MRKTAAGYGFVVELEIHSQKRNFIKQRVLWKAKRGTKLKLKGKSDLIIIYAFFLLVPIVATAYSGCTDSDGGENYLEMGTISVPDDIRTFSDYCYDSTGRGVRASFCNHPKCYLIEHWCTSSQGGYSVASDRIDCNAEGYNGCRNGECVPISTGCFDGTPEGLCSNGQPYYCSDGNLTENCNRCGCPSGRQCDPSEIGRAHV